MGNTQSTIITRIASSSKVPTIASIVYHSGVLVLSLVIPVLIFSFTSFQNLPDCNQGIQELVRVALKYGDLKFSILKKNRELTTLINLLKPYLKNLEIYNEEFLEDIIIQGKISK